MKWKSLFAAALTAAVALPAWAQDATGGGGIPSLSFSFANGRSGARTTVMPTSYESLGIHSVPVAQWIDLDDEDVSANNLPISATDVVQVGDSHANFTLPAPVYVSYSAANGWSYTSGNTRTILQAYLDDGNNGASILVKNVPFTKYDVIVYLATDNANAKFRPVTINGTRYAWTQFGTTENPWSNWSTKNTGTLIVNADANATFGRSQQDVANLGQNAIRVDGLETQTLTIQGSTGIQNNDTGRIERCGIAAIQIIQASDGAIRDTATYQPVISVNMKGSVDSIVGTSGFSGLNPIWNTYWNELPTSGTSESGVGFMDDSGLATSLAIDATYSGVQWSFSSAGRPILGAMANGYREVTTLDLTDVPYSSYNLILYYASDLNNSTKWAATKVTSAVDGSVKYYTYPTDYSGTGAAVAVEEAAAADWGVVSAIRSATDAVAYGGAVMLIEGLTGDITLEMLKDADNRGGLYGFQIVCTGEVVKLTSDVMSLNFATGKDDGSVTYEVSDQEGDFGIVSVPAAEWVDLETKANTDGVAIADTGATVTWSAKNTWNNASATDRLRQAYLDDGNTSGNVGASVTVANVPYSMYDVIVYYSNDAGYAFKPVTVNGDSYTWDKTAGHTVPSQAPDAIDDPVQGTADEAYVFGTVDASASALGTNALRVAAQEAATLTVQGEDTYIEGDNTPKTARGGIAALQVVERKVIDVTAANTDLNAMLGWYAEGTPIYIRVAANATIAGDVTLPADAILDLTAGTFGENPIVSGTLTVTEGVEIRLPATPSVCTIADSIEGTPVVFVNGAYAPDVIISGGTITTGDPTYEWTGNGSTTNWSDTANWSSGVVPDENAAVTVTLAANDAKTITLDKAATVASLTITGPASGSATLTIATVEGAENAKLTVVDKMFTTGNVAVTQNASIAVNGATQTGDVTSGDFVMPNQAIQAGFQVNGAAATYTIASGELLVKVPDTGAGDVSVSNEATLEVGAKGTLTAARARITYYGGVAGSTVTAGTLRIAGQATFSTQMGLLMANYTVDLAGGTMTTPRVNTFNGLAVSAASTLAAPEVGTLTVSGTTKALTGAGSLTLQGTVVFSSAITADYTGELTVADGATVTLGENRPKLSVVKGAKVLITPTTAETTEGTISFATSMTEEPTGVTFTVSGVEEEITASVADGVLTLKWESAMPTLATSSNWSAVDNWTGLTGTDAPTTGTVILDGSNGAIKVTLDTALTGMESILVLGDVTLKTTDAQSTIPACVTPAEGATLTVGANISGASLQSPWVLPAGTTLKVTKGFSSFAYLTLNGAVEIAEGFTGSVEAPSAFDGGLTVNASGVTLTGATNVGVTLALNGSNIAIQGSESEGSTFYTDNGTTVVNKGTGNAITGVTGLSGAVAVESGTFRLTLQSTLNSAFPGATIAKGATLTLAGPDNAQGWWFPVTGAGTLVLDGAIRPMFAAVSGSPTLPKTMVFTATEAEQAAGVISCLNWQNGATLPEGFAVTVNPALNGGAWVPNAVLESGGNAYLRIYNKLPANLPVGVEEAIAEAIQQAAETAGLTKAYTVQLTTKGQPVEVTADMLNDVLGCFTNLTATAEGSVLTYAYDFGVVGVKRNTADNGWVVTAKVQGENAEAGFAEGNAYALTVKVPGETGSERIVNVTTVNETSITSGTVELTVPDTALEGVGDGFTLGVSVSRNAPAQ